MKFDEWFEQRYPPDGRGYLALIRESFREIARDEWEAAEFEGYRAGLKDGAETAHRTVRNVVGPG